MDRLPDDWRTAGPRADGANGPEKRQATIEDVVDGVMPKHVLRVHTIADVIDVVRSARSQRAPVVVRGGGTLLAIGNPPRALDSIVSTTSMDRILSYSPDDMVVTLEAGMTLAALDRELAAAGQRVGLDAARPELATIGGLAATNFNTGVAYCFGYPRDQILGMTVIDGVGRTLRTGGRVVKNVAGYDLPRVFAGSFGTLGVITDVTLRTHPQPEVASDVVLDFTDERSLEVFRARLFGSGLVLRSFDVEGYRDRDRVLWRTRVSIEGTTKQVEYVRDAIATFAGIRRLDSGSPATAPQQCEEPASFVARCAVTPSAALREASTLLTATRTTVDRARVVLECAGMLLRLHAFCSSDDEAASLVEACKRLSPAGTGSLLLERVPPGYKRRTDVWCGPIRGLALMQRLKTKFDPDGVLAPGRFVGGI